MCVFDVTPILYNTHMLYYLSSFVLTVVFLVVVPYFLLVIAFNVRVIFLLLIV